MLYGFCDLLHTDGEQIKEQSTLKDESSLKCYTASVQITLTYQLLLFHFVWFISWKVIDILMTLISSF